MTINKTIQKILAVGGLVGMLAGSACGENSNKDYTGKVSCTKDTDCNQGRECDSDLGYCVDATGSSSGSSSGGSGYCTKDTDCKGERICDINSGYCVDADGGSSSSSSSASSSTSSSSTSSTSATSSSSSASSGYVHPLIGTWLVSGSMGFVEYFWAEGNAAHCSDKKAHGECHIDSDFCFKVTGEYSGTIDFSDGYESAEFSISDDKLTLYYPMAIPAPYARIQTCPNSVSNKSCPPPY